MMPARWQARPATVGPFIRSAVQISFTVSAWNRPKACGGCPPGRVVSSRAANQRWMARSEGAQPSRAARIRRTCAAVRAGFSIFRPTASSTTSASVRGAHCRGAGTSASNPPARRATIHRSMRAPRHRHRPPDGPSCSRAASSRTTCAALPRGQGRVHRRLGQRPPPQRDRLRPLAAGGGLPVCCCHDLPPRECRVCPGLTRPWPARPAVTKAETAATASQGRVDRHAPAPPGPATGPPVRCAATSWAATVASAGNRRRSPAVTASSTARHPRPANPPGQTAGPAGPPAAARPVSACAQRSGPPGEPRPPRPRRRRRHLHRPPPGDASHGRAAARPRRGRAQPPAAAPP